jgi:hypothetical protein
MAEFQVGMKVKIRPARPFAGREAEIRAVSPTRLTLWLLPSGPEIKVLTRDAEPVQPTGKTGA